MITTHESIDDEQDLEKLRQVAHSLVTLLDTGEVDELSEKHDALVDKLQERDQQIGELKDTIDRDVETIDELRAEVGALRSTERVRQQARWDLAAKLTEDYRHHADLAAYAKMRVEGTLHLPVGIKDRGWWVSLMQECIAKRDALYSVILMVRSGLGEQVSAPDGDWPRGMGIYIREFLLEGSEQTFEEYLASIALVWSQYVQPEEEN